MFTVKKAAANRVDIQITGRVDADMMRHALDDLDAQTKDVTKGQMLYTITDFAFPSLAAIGVDLARIPMLFGVIQKFDKCAVLADATWLKAVASVEGALIPGLTIKAFDLDDTAEAEAWLSS